MTWIYRYETKGIQSWILDSNLLRDLAGGSVLVESLAEEAKEGAKAVHAQVLQSTSGSMTALFPTKDALEQFASTWPMRVALRAPGLQLVQTWAPKEEGLAKVFLSLAERRNRVEVTDLEAGPWVMRTGRTGLPSVPTPPDISRLKARMTALEPATLAKERARRALREKSGVVTGGVPWKCFVEELESWPEGPVAVVHADGTGVGRRLMSLEGDLGALESFSSDLKQATQAATRGAIEELSRDQDGNIYARPIVSAGDDLTYVVRALDARRFASRWLQCFEDGTRSLGTNGKGLVGGAGIAIVHPRHPFSQGYRVAETLCSRAKKLADDLKEERGGRDASVLAFQRVTTSKEADSRGGLIAWIVEAESGLASVDRLVDAVRALPRGTLRTWLGLVEQANPAAQQFWDRAREVADESDWKEFAAALEQVGADPQTGLFHSTRAAYTSGAGPGTAPTPLRDALVLRHIEK